jgi:hypothetical protein
MPSQDPGISIPIKLPPLSNTVIREMVACKLPLPCQRHHRHLVLCRHVEPYYRSYDCDKARAERKWAIDNRGKPEVIVLPPNAGVAGRWAQDYGKVPILQAPPHPDFTGWVGRHDHPHLYSFENKISILFSDE